MKSGHAGQMAESLHGGSETAWRWGRDTVWGSSVRMGEAGRNPELRGALLANTESEL